MFLFRQDFVQSWIAEKNNKKKIIKKCRILWVRFGRSAIYKLGWEPEYESQSPSIINACLI